MPLIFNKDMEWAYLAIQGSWDTEWFQWYLGTILDWYGNWQLLVFRPFSENSLLLSYTWSGLLS
jgi:hypothetical protein